MNKDKKNEIAAPVQGGSMDFLRKFAKDFDIHPLPVEPGKEFPVHTVTGRTMSKLSAFALCYGMDEKKLMSMKATHPVHDEIHLDMDYKAIEARMLQPVVDEAVKEKHGELLAIRDAVARWAGFDPSTVTDEQLLKELKGESQNRVKFTNELLSDIEKLVSEKDSLARRNAELADKLQALEDDIKFTVATAPSSSLLDWIRLPEGRDR